MCGRFIQSSRAAQYARLFGANHDDRDGESVPRFNITPGQPVLLVRASAAGLRTLSLARWGLIPAWSKGPDSRYTMINARSETVHSKPAYRLPFRHRRCLIPADGFYEWKPEGRVKQPYCIRRSDGRPLGLAGLWDLWNGPGNEPVESCTIIVTPAEAEVKQVHDRMPLMLAPEAWDAWLDPALQDTGAVLSLMDTRDRPELAVYPVSRDVNKPGNDGPELMKPLDIPGQVENPEG